ncbi:hypothetical protein AGABI2DRAFT_142470 [Agaricus bisporus var. bisporus H97]|uniref:hypothetical protein n=1 Tax=Agaricus bisporus var. bisporus (strain H97 / ATCC MYA-4626 / FGSC 10389) TaxID=936046 RepID=UPI00029F4FA7|nr:hypothetical protein AGABI2DRAFT_142470 [Agaricus bisporus var. bisporus H97]EKV48288.1 hypothetical protein AGABI2DRAFT_142470 [Agaricus bisporus var. bisporus H97]
MASTRSSVRRRSITSFLQSRKPKESESPITSQKKPPDRNGKPPATAMLPPSRTASQPTPAPPVPTIPNQAEYSASQPTPHTSSWANEVQANDSEPSPMDTPPSQEEVEKAGDTDIDSQDKKVNDAWNWLVDKKLLNDVDAITSDDILTTLYKIASNTTFTKEIIRKSVEAATFMLEIAIRNERQQELPREEDNVEEGEIRGEKDNNSAALKAIEEMKVTLQDTIIRATTALEEATKELKESKTIQETYPMIPPESPVPKQEP